MKKLFKFLILALGALMLSLTACSSPISQESVEESMQYAEALIEKGDWSAALECVKQITDTATFAQLNVSQLGRLSMIYMQLSEEVDQAVNLGIATDIFDYVYQVNADSAAAFYNSVEPVQMQFVESMQHSSVARKAPMDISSIPVDTYIDEDTLVFIDQQPE